MAGSQPSRREKARCIRELLVTQGPSRSQRQALQRGSLLALRRDGRNRAVPRRGPSYSGGRHQAPLRTHRPSDRSRQDQRWHRLLRRRRRGRLAVRARGGCRTRRRERRQGQDHASEKIEFNDALKAVGVDVHETDLAEPVLQIAAETPSHIATPAHERHLLPRSTKHPVQLIESPR